MSPRSTFSRKKRANGSGPAPRRALDRARKEPFGIIPLKGPLFERVTVLRSDEKNPLRVSRNRHPSSVAGVLNMPFDFRNRWTTIRCRCWTRSPDT